MPACDISTGLKVSFKCLFLTETLRVSGEKMIVGDKRALKATLTHGISDILQEVVDLYSINLNQLGELSLSHSLNLSLSHSIYL